MLEKCGELMLEEIKNRLESLEVDHRHLLRQKECLLTDLQVLGKKLDYNENLQSEIQDFLESTKDEE